MDPIDVKSRYPKHALTRFLDTIYATPKKALCVHCGCYISETMAWQCGHCKKIVPEDLLVDEDGETDMAGVLAHSIFGSCPHCGFEPPAVVCPHCEYINPLTDQPFNPDHAACSPPEDPDVVRERQNDQLRQAVEDELEAVGHLTSLHTAHAGAEAAERDRCAARKRGRADDIRQDMHLIALEAELEALRNPPVEKSIVHEMAEAIGYALREEDEEKLQAAKAKLLELIEKDDDLSVGRLKQLRAAIDTFIQGKRDDAKI